jgi:Fe-S-cluster containining protein
MSHETAASFSFVLSASDPIRQPLRMGQQTFPGIWREMMPAAMMQLRFPEEREANCGRCPKSCYDNWRPDYRCCTYHPRISNFLLGLACQTPEGDRAVDDLLQRGMLLPEGMHSSPRQWLDFVADDHEDQFGKSQRVLCPIMDPTSGLCRVHVFRNSVCSTYFCTKDQGQAGEIFWSQIQTLGTQLEMRLAQWALAEIGFDVAASLKALDELTPILSQLSTDQGWKPEALELIWGPYWGREKELLHACAAVIVKNRGQLWSIAQQQVIAEPRLFDEALHQQAPDAHQQFLEDDEELWQEVLDLNALWSDCLKAHDALWAEPSGLFTLSPNVSFMPNEAQSAEEIHHQGKAFFIEYRFRNPERSLYFRLAITEEQKKLLEGFDQLQLKLTDANPEALEFLKEMIHRQVLWAVSDSSPDQ